MNLKKWFSCSSTVKSWRLHSSSHRTSHGRTLIKMKCSDSDSMLLKLDLLSSLSMCGGTLYHRAISVMLNCRVIRNCAASGGIVIGVIVDPSSKTSRPWDFVGPL